MMLRSLTLPGVFTLISLTACVQAPLQTSAPASPAPLALPAALNGKAQVLGPQDPDYARAVVSAAVQPAGRGGVSEALVIRFTQDTPVYRLWSGPDRKDARGNTNRIGGWWSHEAPRGSSAAYRVNYAICAGWNELTWVATCTIKAGAVAAIGPGQSVSAETCGDPTGKEQYPANARDWQMYVDKPWTRSSELVCPPDSSDYEADATDIARARAR